MNKKMKKAVAICLATLVVMFCLDTAAGLVREAKFPDKGEVTRPAVGAALVLPSFDGATVAVELNSRNVSTSGIVTYGGRTSGSWLNNATLTVVKGGFVATVTDNATSHVFTFRRLNGFWTVREVAPSRKGRCGTPGHTHRKQAAERGEKAALVRAAALTGNPLVDGAAIMQRGEVVTNVVDILVGVDKSAATWIREKSMFAGTENAVETFAAWAVMRCNCTYANTGLDQFFTFNLAGTVEIDVDCSRLRDNEGYVDSNKILDDLVEGRGEGNYKAAYKNVRDKREAVCADIVSLLVSCDSDVIEGLVGIGYALDNDSIRNKYFPDSAYNVCLVESVEEDCTMAHEIGHNMGAGHAEMKDKDNCGPQLYDYSAGYYFCVTNDNISMQGGTVMAYDSDGYEDDYGYGERWGQAPENAENEASWNVGRYTIVPYFSSPNHTYKYELEGHDEPVDSGVALGDEKHDNTRLLSLTYPLAANYRVSKCSLSLVAPAGGDRTLGGSGVYNKGSTVTMKATPAAGCVFAGWYMSYDEESGAFSDPLTSSDGVDFRSPTAKITLPGGTVSQVVVYARFATANEDGVVEVDIDDEKTSDNGELALALGPSVKSLSLPKLALTGLPSGLKYNATTLTIAGTATKPGVYVVTVKTTNATVKNAVETRFSITVPNLSCAALPNLRQETDYYNFEAGMAFVPDSVNCSAADKDWKVAASGLPTGLKFDTKSGVITGVATKPGTYTVTFTATKGKEKQVATITMNVAALPDAVIGTFNGFVGTDNGDEYLGTFQLTTTDAGKLTAKITTAAGSYSFSGTCWDYVESGFYSVALSTKNGDKLTLWLDSTAGWDKNQLRGTFLTGRVSRAVVARKNAFGKTWYFNAEGNETDGWILSYAENAKTAALTVTLNADGATKIAGKLGTLSVSASGYADVTSLSKGVIIADFAPVVSVKVGKATVKRVLSVGTNLWFDRSNEHDYIGSVYVQE